jgi:hypothetical protein
VLATGALEVVEVIAGIAGTAVAALRARLSIKALLFQYRR